MRSTRLAATLLVLAALGLPPGIRPPLAAQAQPVTGGGSFNDAPEIGPGTFADTIRPSEQLFYKLDVRRGQRLAATIRFRAQPREGGPLGPLVELVLYNPGRNQIERDFHVYDFERELSIRVESDAIGTGDDVADAGGYYVSVGAEPDDRLADQEGPFELTLELLGQAEVDTASTSIELPTTLDRAAPVAGAGKNEQAVDGLVAPALVGLAAGALLGFGAAWIWRRRATPPPGA